MVVEVGGCWQAHDTCIFNGLTDQRCLTEWRCGEPSTPVPCSVASVFMYQSYFIHTFIYLFSDIQSGTVMSSVFILKGDVLVFC